MNAPMEPTGRLRRSPQSERTLHQVSPIVSNQKPMFQVLEDSAVAYEAAASGERECPITRTPATPPISDFSLLSDNILSDCQEVVSNSPTVNNPTTLVPYTKVQVTTKVPAFFTKVDNAPLRQTIVRRETKVPNFKLCKVIDRRFKWLRPNELKAPNYIVGYCIETLECGSKMTIPSMEGEHFTAKARYCHECSKSYIEAIEGRKPQDKVNGAKKRKMAGNSAWPLVFAAVILTGWAIWFKYHRPITYTYGPPDSFRVLRQLDDYSFLMQRVHNGTAMVPVTMYFCHDYAPKFEQGFTLRWLAYEDRGKCYSVAVPDSGYVIVRDKSGLPTVPSNCTNSADKPVVCDGEPQFK